MSGVISSKLHWKSGRVRALLAVFMGLAMLVPAVAAQAQAAPAVIQPTGVLCVEGTVINFDETLMPFPEVEDNLKDNDAEDPGLRWQVVATSSFTPTVVYTQTVDENAYFEFDQFRTNQAGEWTFSLILPSNPAPPITPNGDPTLFGWRAINGDAQDDVAAAPISLTVDVRYGKDDCINIRFKVKRPVPVIVTKIDDNHVTLPDWHINVKPAPHNWFASPDEEVTDEFGVAEFLPGLTEGKWIFSERAPKGTAYTPVVPESGKQLLDVECVIDPQNGLCTPYFLRFKNRITEGCIEVTKRDSFTSDIGTTSDPLAGWKIKVKQTNGTVVQTGFTDATGVVEFEHLPVGPYLVVEELQDGWTEGPPDFVKSYTVLVTGDVNDTCAKVDFINVQQPGFCIKGRKIDTNPIMHEGDNENAQANDDGKVGIPNWEITATPLDEGGYPDPFVGDNVDSDLDGSADEELVTHTDAEGRYRFDLPANDYRIPGSHYQVCEAEVEGWLPHTPICQTVTVPLEMGDCAKATDFENQQVGHWESVVYGHSSDHRGGSCANSHTVEPGESLYGIGAAYGVSASAMMAANQWVYSRPHYYVYSGDSVCIP